MNNIAKRKPNYLNCSFAEFIQLWDRKEITIRLDSLKIQRSPQGNINIEGKATCSKGIVLVKSHPKFEEAVENDVRQLVLALIEKFDCVTYSSCQGHFSVGDNVPMRQRRIGILPRTNAEYRELLYVLNRYATIVNSKATQDYIRVLVSEDVLEFADSKMPSIEIIFKSNNCDEVLYFQEIESLYTDFVRIILLEEQKTRS